MEFFCIADSNKNFFALAGAVVPVVFVVVVVVVVGGVGGVGVGVAAVAVLFVVIDVFVVVVRVKIRSLLMLHSIIFIDNRMKTTAATKKMVFIVLTDLSCSSFLRQVFDLRKKNFCGIFLKSNPSKRKRERKRKKQ